MKLHAATHTHKPHTTHTHLPLPGEVLGSSIETVRGVLKNRQVSMQTGREADR